MFSRTLQFIFTLIHNFQCFSESLIASQYEKRAILFQKLFLGQIMLRSPGGGAPFGLWPVSP